RPNCSRLKFSRSTTTATRSWTTWSCSSRARWRFKPSAPSCRCECTDRGRRTAPMVPVPATAPLSSTPTARTQVGCPPFRGLGACPGRLVMGFLLHGGNPLQLVVHWEVRLLTESFGRALRTGAKVVALTATLLLAMAPVNTAFAANAAANIDQCTNGPKGPPLVVQPCINVTIGGTTYANWANGNSNGNTSHWREEEFPFYRA